MKKISLLLLFSGLVSMSVFVINCTKTKDNEPVYPVDCGHRIAASYSGSDHCTSAGQNTYLATIMAVDSTRITFSNLGGATVTGVLDCEKNTITIPAQTFPGNFSISGTGTFTINRIIINWSGLSLGTPINCSTTYTR